MILKVCGMREPENVRELARLNPDYVGFIFHPESPRYARSMPPGTATGVNGVAVFVDAPTEKIMRVCESYGISTVQLHGSESLRQCRELSENGLKIFKAFGLGVNPDWHSISEYEKYSDLFVFDTKTRSHGGSGRKFDWSILADYPLDTPYLLSGGIGPDDIIPTLPGMAGVDLNSRFEIEPGLKDIQLIKKFIEHEPNRLALRS